MRWDLRKRANAFALDRTISEYWIDLGRTAYPICTEFVTALWTPEARFLV